MSIPATDSAYNAHSRAIAMRLDIYFDGVQNDPLVVTRDNFLSAVSVLEETTADNDLPFGTVTANEIDISLSNIDGIFSPTNTEGPYYGKIKRGVPIHAYIRPSITDTYEWQEFGKFYVVDWSAEITGLSAEVSATDKLGLVFSQPAVNVPVSKNTSFYAFYTQIFNELDLTASVDSTLASVLHYAYSIYNNHDLLSNLSIGACADCYCGRDGNVVVQSARRTRQLRATLTDDDQIISVNSGQSTHTSFDGVSVTCNVPQETTPGSVLELNDIALPVGTTVLQPVMLTMQPLIRLLGVELRSDKNLTLSNLYASCTHVGFTLTNDTLLPATASIRVNGLAVESVASTISDVGDKLLVVDNKYVQSPEYATTMYNMLEAYVNSTLPTLEISVRGNPLIALGDKVRILSSQYNIDFTGIVVRSYTEYSGSLTGTIKLVNASILEV